MNLNATNFDPASLMGLIPAETNGGNPADRITGSSPDGDFSKIIENLIMGAISFSPVVGDDPNAVESNQSLLQSPNQSRPVQNFGSPEFTDLIADTLQKSLSVLTAPGFAPQIDIESLPAYPDGLPIDHTIISPKFQEKEPNLQDTLPIGSIGTDIMLQGLALMNLAAPEIPDGTLTPPEPSAANDAMVALSQDGQERPIACNPSSSQPVIDLMQIQELGESIENNLTNILESGERLWPELVLKPVMPEKLDPIIMSQLNLAGSQKGKQIFGVENPKSAELNDLLYGRPIISDRLESNREGAILIKSDITPNSELAGKIIPNQMLVDGLNIKETRILGANQPLSWGKESNDLISSPILANLPASKDLFPDLRTFAKNKAAISSNPNRQDFGTIEPKDNNLSALENLTKPINTDPRSQLVDRAAGNSNIIETKAVDDSGSNQSVQATAKLPVENQLDGIIGHIQDNRSVPKAPEAEPMRFILPKDLSRTGYRNGQTIILKMEPEHLGSIRLTLSTRQDSITGRLVVESAAARSAVQSNLDNLYDQLSRQGIKLDHFEVSLGGGQSGYKFAQSRSSGDMKNQSRLKKNFENVGKIMRATPATGNTGMYIGAAGVNWIA